MVHLDLCISCPNFPPAAMLFCAKHTFSLNDSPLHGAVFACKIHESTVSFFSFWTTASHRTPHECRPLLGVVGSLTGCPQETPEVHYLLQKRSSLLDTSLLWLDLQPLLLIKGISISVLKFFLTASIFNTQLRPQVCPSEVLDLRDVTPHKTGLSQCSGWLSVHLLIHPVSLPSTCTPLPGPPKCSLRDMDLAGTALGVGMSVSFPESETCDNSDTRAP